MKHGVQGFTRSSSRPFASRRLSWGWKDAVDSVSAGRQTARDLHARFALIPGAGHLGLLTDPTSVARAIESR